MNENDVAVLPIAAGQRFLHPGACFVFLETTQLVASCSRPADKMQAYCVAVAIRLAPWLSLPSRHLLYNTHVPVQRNGVATWFLIGELSADQQGRVLSLERLIEDLAEQQRNYLNGPRLRLRLHWDLPSWLVMCDYGNERLQFGLQTPDEIEDELEDQKEQLEQRAATGETRVRPPRGIYELVDARRLVANLDSLRAPNTPVWHAEHWCPDLSTNPGDYSASNPKMLNLDSVFELEIRCHRWGAFNCLPDVFDEEWNAARKATVANNTLVSPAPIDAFALNARLEVADDAPFVRLVSATFNIEGLLTLRSAVHHQVALVCACRCGRIEATWALVAAGAIECASRDDLVEAVEFASVNGWLEFVVFILTKHRVKFAHSFDENMPLVGAFHHAVRHKHLELARAFLTHCRGIPLNRRNIKEYLPLQYAVRNNDATMVALLCEFGANASEIGIEGSPMITACQFNHPAMLELLLQHGAAVDDDNPRESALCAALNGGHEQVAKRLLECGANPSKQLMYNRSPLYCALSNVSMMRLILSSPRFTVNVKEIPAYWRRAVDKGNVEALELLKTCIDVAHGESHDTSLLVYAAQLRRIHVVQWLLDNGAPPIATEWAFSRATDTAVLRLLLPRTTREQVQQRLVVWANKYNDSGSSVEMKSTLLLLLRAGAVADDIEQHLPASLARPKSLLLCTLFAFALECTMHAFLPLALPAYVILEIVSWLPHSELIPASDQVRYIERCRQHYCSLFH